MENMAKQQTLVWTFSIGLVGNAGFLYSFAFKVTFADLSEALIFHMFGPMFFLMFTIFPFFGFV